MKTRLEELRIENNITQNQCAQIANIARNTYINYEKDKREIPLYIIKKFAIFYNTSIDYITYITDNKKHYQYREEILKEQLKIASENFHSKLLN